MFSLLLFVIWAEQSLCTGTSFHLFSIILFLSCSNIATQYVCKISKGCVQQFQSYIIFGGKWTEEMLQVRVFTRFFFILFLICSIIATQYVFKFSKGCTQRFQSYIKFGGKWAEEKLQVRVFTRSS